MDIHVNRDGQEFGPFPPETVQQYLAAGQLLPTDLAWHEGLPNWTSLGELMASLEGTAPAPVPPVPALEAAPAAGKSGTGVLILRICLGLILVMALIVAGLDRVAAFRWNAAQETVNEVLDGGTVMSPEALQEELGRDPVSVDERGTALVAVYEWGGSIRVYRLEVVCSRDGRGHLVASQRPKTRMRLSDEWKSMEGQ